MHTMCNREMTGYDVSLTHTEGVPTSSSSDAQGVSKKSWTYLYELMLHTGWRKDVECDYMLQNQTIFTTNVTILYLNNTKAFCWNRGLKGDSTPFVSALKWCCWNREPKSRCCGNRKPKSVSFGAKTRALVVSLLVKIDFLVLDWCLAWFLTAKLQRVQTDIMMTVV